MNEASNDQIAQFDTCVVGSGIGGLSIATRLESGDTDYVVLDKGRTPGGRAATRRFAESRFDHGLPWLTDQGPLTMALVERGLEAGILSELEIADGQTAWYSPAGISALGKYLAADLNVRNQVRVTAISPDPSGLRLAVETVDGPAEITVRRNLYLAMPLPQVQELIEPLVGSSFKPGADPFRKCIVGMIQCNPASTGPETAGTLIPDHLKFPDVKPGISFRLSPEESDELWDSDENEIKSFLVDQVGGSPAPDQIQIMKWRYANGSGVVKKPFFETKVGPVAIAICGDAFFGGQAEGTEAALMSAAAAFDALG